MTGFNTFSRQSSAQIGTGRQKKSDRRRRSEETFTPVNSISFCLRCVKYNIVNNHEEKKILAK